MQDRTGSSGRDIGQPRRYTIQSDFGKARERRSRKNRPCDVCRRRKTACVISEKPPCLFCRTKGLVCQSSPRPGATSVSQSPEKEAPPHCVSAAITDGESSRRPSFISTAQRSPITNNTQSDLIVPGVTAQTERASAAIVHHGLVRQDEPTTQGFISSGVSPQGLPATDKITYTLEDMRNRTAHSMGLAAEQDTHLLDAFRSVIMSEHEEVDANVLQVYNGGSHPNDPPVHFLMLEDEFPDHTKQATLAASDAIESLVWPHGLTLVRLFFRHVHPVYPVVSKYRFLRQYAAEKKDIPASLRGAVYALALPFWGSDGSRSEPCPFLQHEVVCHAHIALRRELEAPNLYKLQASLLLLHMRPPDVDSVETPSTWILTSQITACAQMIGLHQDPEKWSIAPWEKRLRKRLWWASYVADCWSAVCHGNPPHIGPTSFNTALLEMSDLRSDEDVPDDLSHLIDPDDASFHISEGARFLETVNIARILREILDCSFRVNKDIGETQDLVQIKLDALRNKLREWPSLIPHCLAPNQRSRSCGASYNGPLHLSFHAAQVLLFRGLMHPATREAKNTPSSNLRRWFPVALKEFQSFITFMENLGEKDLQQFWGRHSRSQFILCGNFLVYLFLLASETDDITAAYQMLESFHQSLGRLGATESVDAKLLLRPVILRIDSFFAQAAELMKEGRRGSVAEPSPAGLDL